MSKAYPERSRRDRMWLVVVAAAWLAGCALESPNPRFNLRYEKGMEATDLDALIRRAGPGPVSVIDLGRTAWVSHHLVVVREGEENLSEMQADEEDRLDMAEGLTIHSRLGCQAVVQGDVVVEIPK